MLILLILGALAIVLVAGALLFQARRIKRRHLRFFAAGAPTASPEATRVIDAPQALYHGTTFADGVALLAPEWKDACVCDLFCTEEALFIQREGPGALLSIALSSVSEAALHRAFAPIAGKDLPMLRLTWARGGETLLTELSLKGGMASLETLRREIHLRQGNVAEQLKPLLERKP